MSRHDQRSAGDAATTGSSGPRFSRFLTIWGPTVVYIAAILVMAMRPAPRLPRVNHIDKYFHVMAYGLLALTAYRSFFRGQVRYPFLSAVVLGVVVGASDEIVQFLGRIRSADIHDWYADMAGTLSGALAARRLIVR